MQHLEGIFFSDIFHSKTAICHHQQKTTEVTVKAKMDIDYTSSY